METELARRGARWPRMTGSATFERVRDEAHRRLRYELVDGARERTGIIVDLQGNRSKRH